MELGDRNLRVQRASIGIKQSAGMDMNVNAMAMMAGTTSSDLEPSRVLQLLNMVTAEELLDTEEYEGMENLQPQLIKLANILSRYSRRYQRRMLEIRNSPGCQDSSTIWQQHHTVGTWSWQGKLLMIDCL